MKLAIADPPYLGRSERWYGTGRGHGLGSGRADFHPNAWRWDQPAAHIDLVQHLNENYDGWAVAAAADSLPVYLSACTAPVRIAAWVKENAIPSGSRIRSVWEPVIFRVPDGRSGYDSGARADDVFIKGINQAGFPGRKPDQWTHWVLDLLGYQPGDTVADMFKGSGAVVDAVATYTPFSPQGKRKVAPTAQMQRVRTTARASSNKRAAVLAALRAGASVRSVALEAGISTSTVQRWKKVSASMEKE